MGDDWPNCGVWLGNEPLPNDSAWARQHAEIERLRAAGDALVAAIRTHDLTEQDIKAWEEARRG